VGEQDDVAQATGSLRLTHQVKQRRQHFRSAIRLETADIASRCSQVLWHCGQRFGSKFVKVTAERDDREAMAAGEPIQRLEQSSPGLLDGGSLHRAGYINQVKHFHREALARLNRRGKCCQQEMGFGRVRRRRQEYRRLRLFAPALLHFEDEILIGNGGTVSQLDALPAIIEALYFDLVRDALDGGSVEAGIEINRERKIVARAAFGMADQRGDSRRIRHCISVGSRSSSRVTHCLSSWYVAWADHHGERQLYASVIPA